MGWILNCRLEIADWGCEIEESMGHGAWSRGKQSWQLAADSGQETKVRGKKKNILWERLLAAILRS